MARTLQLRERRHPSMPNHTPPFIEQRVLGFALAYPGLGPQRISAELAHERWGGTGYQRTILEECWRASFARYFIPKFTGLRRDLVTYLNYYNDERAHTGRHDRGQTPEAVIEKAKIWASGTPRRRHISGSVQAMPGRFAVGIGEVRDEARLPAASTQS